MGALSGALFAWFLVGWFSHQNLSVLADLFFPSLMLVTVAAWLGGWLEGVAYGPQIVGSGWGLRGRDEWGLYTLRFPTQLVGVFLTLSLFWLIEVRSLSHKWHSGWAGAWGLLCVSIICFGLSFLRSDPTLYWKGLRLDAWSSLSLVVVSIFFLFLQWRSTRI